MFGSFVEELRKRMGRCEELETEQLQLRKELEEATEAQQKCAQQLAELQTRARQAQDCFYKLLDRSAIGFTGYHVHQASAL